MDIYLYFEADFLWKVSLKMLNLAYYNSISHYMGENFQDKS